MVRLKGECVEPGNWKGDKEQERRFLPGSADGDNDVTSTLLSRPRRGCFSLRLVAITAATCAITYFIAAFGAQSRQETILAPVQNLGPVTTSDFILDPEWDFVAAPRRRDYDWVVRDQVHNPDGVYRPMLLVNNEFPGPLIEVNEGDTIVVHVSNRAVNATSIHWHGMYQNGTPYMDGPVGITQCAIPPGGNFTCEFVING